MKSLTILSIFLVDDRYLFHLSSPAGPPSTDRESSPSSWSLFGSTPLDPGLRADIDRRFNTAAEIVRAFHAGQTAAEPGGAPKSGDPFRSLGRFLFQQLVPIAVQNALRGMAPGAPLLLATNDPLLPWELLHDGDNYLALKLAIGRRLLSTMPPRIGAVSGGEGRSFLFITNPTGDLPQTQVEAEALLDMFDTAQEPINTVLRGGRHAQSVEILKHLVSGDYDLIHYSGHAKPDALVLFDGELRANELREKLNGQPLVFLNACRSARIAAVSASEGTPGDIPLAGMETTSLASAFILGGAKAFIGVLWPAFDQSSSDFARWFYSMALDGMSIGEALRLSRERMRQVHPNDPIWASYILYGDPTIKIANLERREKRRVTVLVVRLEGLSRLYHDLGLDKASEVQERLIGGLLQVVDRYGGEYQEPFAGVLGVRFGVTSRHEDNAQRAVRAALAMRDHLAALNQAFGDTFSSPLTVRFGVSTRQVIVRRIDGDNGITCHISGDVADVASGLSANAGQGEIVVDEVSRKLVRNAFFLEALEEALLLDGHQAIARYCVKGVREGPELESQIVGRESELAQLRGWWQEVMGGQGRMVDIAGAAGVGKSCLLQAFRLEMRRAQHHWIEAACHECFQNSPYALLAQVLRGLAGINGDDDHYMNRTKLEDMVRDMVPATSHSSDQWLSEGVGLLSQVIGLDISVPTIETLDPELRQKKVADIFQAALARQAARSPLILALDDLQWIDEASLAVLDMIAGAIGRLPVLVLAAYRPGWTPGWAVNWGHYRLLTVDELGREAQRKLIANLLNTDILPEDLVRTVVDQTGGNPLFVEELVESLLEQEVLAWSAGRLAVQVDLGTMKLPDKIDEVIQARLSKLPASGYDLLQRASVIGPEFEYPVLANLTSDTARASLDRDLGELRSRRLIDAITTWPETQYAFYHGLIYRTTYDSLAERFRRAMHKLVARLLEQMARSESDKPVERIAHHYYQGGDRVRAVGYCLAAAERAAANWSNQTALEWYARVQEIAASFIAEPARPEEEAGEATPERINKWLVAALSGAATIQWKTGQHDKARTNYLAALEMARGHDQFSPAERANLCYQLGHVQEAQGDFEGAWLWLQQGLAEVGDEEPLVAAQLNIWRGLIHFRRGEPEEADEWCRHGIGIAERLGSVRDQAMGHNLLGIIYRRQNKSELALREHEISLALYEEESYNPGIERAISNLACVHQDQEAWGVAERYFERSRDLSERTGEVFRLAGAYTNLGEINRLQGIYDKAVYWYQLGKELAEDNGLDQVKAIALMNLGATRIALNDPVTAGQELVESRAIFDYIDSRQFFAEIRRYQAELLWVQGAAGEALEMALEALAWAELLEQELEIQRIQSLIKRIKQGTGTASG